MTPAPPSTQQKAAQINRDARRYGTFAEIGAGQEVARWFFHVGGAAGTVAKTMSAYDMAVSDAIYGPAERYVSRQRLQAMLDHEFTLLRQRLDALHGAQRTFFAFANTVATHSFSRKEEGHGWMGIRFQAELHGEPSEIVLHIRLLEKENTHQQEALGVLGVNLIHGAFFQSQPAALIASLLDNLSWERVEVDMIRFSGPAFAGVDNRLMALQLVQQGLTEAAMFTAAGEAAQWSEVLYKKPVLVQRGSFRPITRSTLDVLERAREAFRTELRSTGEEPVVFMEMTLRDLTTGDAIDPKDFLERAEMLRALGQTVLISNFRRFHRLAAYLARYTNRPIGIALGAVKLGEIFDETFYNESEGGLLGGLGQLFRVHNRLFVYPMLNLETGEVSTVDTFRIAPKNWYLYQHLRENYSIIGLTPSHRDMLPIRSRAVLDKIQAGDSTWEELVPAAVAEIIRGQRLFGWQPPGGSVPASGAMSTQ
jgi:hypothetical protein